MSCYVGCNVSDKSAVIQGTTVRCRFYTAHHSQLIITDCKCLEKGVGPGASVCVCENAEMVVTTLDILILCVCPVTRRSILFTSSASE